MPKCVTYVPGILCNLCVRKLTKPGPAPGFVYLEE